MIRIHI